MTTFNFRIYVTYKPAKEHSRDTGVFYEWVASCADPLPVIASRYSWMGPATTVRGRGHTREEAIENLQKLLTKHMVDESTNEGVTIEQAEIEINIP